MYEPLFGVNVGTGKVVNWLGQNYTWLDSLTIQVTLREGIYWVKLPAGALTDPGTVPEIYRSITSADVQYSWYLYAAFTDSPTFSNQMTALQTRVGSMSNFEIVNDRVFKVHLNSSYPFSDVAVRTITSAWPILPKDVWTQIAGNYTNLLTFANDWSSPDMNPAWRVASGMYLPYYYDDLRMDSIAKRNDLWWGKDSPAFHRLPNPQYVENFIYASNIPIPPELEANNIDWSGSFIADLQTIIPQYPQIHTYYTNLPYFPDKSVKLLVPNHRRWPIGEPWLDKAIASTLDYQAYSDVASSGYMDTTPSPLLIPKDDGLARLLLNTTIENQYRVPFDPTGASGRQLLDEHCFQQGGVWYTDDGPSADYLALYPDHAPITDALPDHAGINVPLGPWQLLDWAGWTDVNAIDLITVDNVATIGITLTTDWLDWGGATTKMDTNNYDFVHYVMHAGMNNNFFERYTQFFTGSYEGLWNHYGSYRNPTLVSLIASLDSAPAGSQAQQDIANQIEIIVGENLPIIPNGGHPDWCIFNNKYWQGWPDQYSPVLGAGPYANNGQNGAVLTIIFNLIPHTADINGDGKVDILDIFSIAKAFGTKPGDTRWITINDLNNDRKVDILDIFLVAKNFNKPPTPL